LTTQSPETVRCDVGRYTGFSGNVRTKKARSQSKRRHGRVQIPAPDRAPQRRAAPSLKKDTATSRCIISGHRHGRTIEHCIELLGWFFFDVPSTTETALNAHIRSTTLRFRLLPFFLRLFNSSFAQKHGSVNHRRCKPRHHVMLDNRPVGV
ncbi:hypothetical protein CT0861_07074, partial [Colletotrichum tofieldiae]